MALVSIITPVYNSEAYILEVYDSIKNQTYTQWEWLVVDDCSTDKSYQKLLSIEDPRVKVFQLSKNSGAAEARNLGLRNAQGTYISFLDSDDLWLPNFLEKTITFLQDHQEALVYTNYRRVDENLQPILDDFVAVDYVDYNRLLYNCPIFLCASVYDRRKVGDIQIPKVDLREDHAMWFLILTKIKYARALNETLVIYRIRENSVSRDKLKMMRKQYDVYRKYLKLSPIKSAYYTFCWALNGLKKYGRI
ncbi:Chondroitin polymerase [Weeksella virosa]|uniref:glycosyltransferase family 2 protein n=1 Tax=Weeksella virosa TaxID=1014 RepID=UPI000E00F4DA|nr:glycosyltransferase family 2 protein [Weeksella virosa]SUP53598.1 Chondroitin polymerase [Weeksella virosa]